MYESYADVLESYMIAEEGFGNILKTTGKVIGGITATAIAAPFVVVGGMALIGSIEDRTKSKKLLKTIKNNKGKYDYYHDDIYKIINKYSHDILGILEPINKNVYVNSFSKLIPICNEMKNIRNQFCKISVSDIESYNYNTICNKLSTLLKKASNILEEIKNIDITSLESNPVKLNESTFSKLGKIHDNIFTIINPGDIERNDSSEIMTDDYYEKMYYDSDGDYYDRDRKYKIKNKSWQDCVRAYDELIDIFREKQIMNGVKHYVNNCKFAINPNSKLR